MTMMYLEIGNKINQDILKNQRAEYGKEIVATLSRQLSWSHFLAFPREILEAKLHQAIESAKEKYLVDNQQKNNLRD